MCDIDAFSGIVKCDLAYPILDRWSAVVIVVNNDHAIAPRRCFSW